MSESRSRTYTVEGMHCDHCRASVAEGIGEIEGVGGVDVDLESGRVEVSGERFTDDQVEAAVAAAGYQVAEVAG